MKLLTQVQEAYNRKMLEKKKKRIVAKRLRKQAIPVTNRAKIEKQYIAILLDLKQLEHSIQSEMTKKLIRKTRGRLVEIHKLL